MTDVFAIQDEISLTIVDKLRVSLSGDRPLIKRHTENVEAYTLFLKGRYQLFKFTAESMPRSREYFEHALAIDPEYALAWNGLAMYYWYLGHYGFMPSRETIVQCKQAATKALELDEMLAEMHSLMAMLCSIEFDWKGAEREFRRALELGPRSVDVLTNYSHHYLVPLLRLDEAVAAAQNALELDPLSPYLQCRLGHKYHLMRQYDRAVKIFRNALELDPQYYYAYLMLAHDYIHMGKLNEALETAETLAQLRGQNPWLLAELAWVYGQVGRTDQAQKYLEELQLLAQKVYIKASAFGGIYLGLGEIDAAFDWFEKSIDERDSLILTLFPDPGFDSMRSHPRYHALLRRMNLEP